MITSFGKGQRAFFDNVAWLLASLLLAVIVWVTATLNSDPFIERAFRERLAIQILVDDDVIITNTPTSRATVVIRARQSVFDQLAADDIQVVADLRNITTFERVTVPLRAVVSQQRQVAVASITPSQITVEVQQLQERLVPLNVVMQGTPPITVEVGTPSLNVPQVLIRGTTQAVASVESASITVDLNNQRENIVADLSPQALDDEGNVVSSVTIEPDIVGVNVPITPRTDVKEVRITPNIVGEPPEGYTLTPDFTYEPEVVFVTGPPELLEQLPRTLFTVPIDLSTYTNDFEIRVPVELPSEELVLITGQRVTVSIGIDPIITSRQFDSVPVEIIGIEGEFEAVPSPSSVTVLVNGPQLLISTLRASDLRVIVDANAVTQAGTLQLQPIASANIAQVDSVSLSVLPTTLDVEFRAIDVTPTATP